MRARLSAACVFVLAALLSAGCPKSASQQEAVRPVRAIKVGDLKAIQGRQFPGMAKAKDAVDLSFRVSGPLVELPVDVGTKVKKGDTIAAIDPRDFQAALDNAQATLAQARANLTRMQVGARPEEVSQLKAAVAEAEAIYRQANTEHERNLSLLPAKAVTPAEVEISLARRASTAAQLTKAKEDLNIGLKGARKEDLEAKQAEVKALEAAATNAKNQLDYAVLKAPFDGDVAAKYVDNFQTVQAKQPVVRLLDLSKIEVTIQVPESVIALVPRVKKAVCTFDAWPEKEFPGRVTKIGAEASQTTRTFPVTIEVDQVKDTPIQPGMAATVRARPEKEDEAANEALVVPPGAVFAAGAGQESCVWVVAEGGDKVTQRTVKTGKLTPVGLTVTDGLKPGEWVVTAGVNSLRKDQQVKILQEGSR